MVASTSEGEAFRYTIYGCEIVVPGEIPGLVRSTGGGDPWRVRFARVDTSSLTAPVGESSLVVRHVDHGCLMRFADGSSFAVDAFRRRVTVDAPQGASIEDTATYMIGPVAGMLARFDGKACFHAAVVELRGGAHVLCGPSESGKSTTAAAFVQAGLGVSSDDICVVDTANGSLRALPGATRIALWPDGARLVFGDGHSLPLIARGWEKLYLDLLEPPRYTVLPCPIEGIWFFDAATDVVEEMSGATCLTTLVSNAHQSSHLTPGMKRRDFEVAARLATTVPFRRLPAKLGPRERVSEVLRVLSTESG